MYVAIRDVSILETGCKNVFDCAKKLRISNLELEVNRDLVTLHYNLKEQNERRKLLQDLNSYNQKICALLLEVEFEENFTKMHEDWIINAIRIASDLGVKAVRIGSLNYLKDESLISTHIDRISSTLRRILSETSECDVYLAMENHGSIGNRRDFLNGLISKIDNERFKLTLDVANFYWFGYPLTEIYDITKEFGSKTGHTHIKNFIYPENKKNIRRKVGEDYPRNSVPIYEGDINYELIVKILKESGYNEDLTIEEESLAKFPLSERINVLSKDAQYIRNILSSF